MRWSWAARSPAAAVPIRAPWQLAGKAVLDPATAFKFELYDLSKDWTQTTDANGAVPIQGQNGLYANGYDVQVAKYIAAELGMVGVHHRSYDETVAELEALTGRELR